MGPFPDVISIWKMRDPLDSLISRSYLVACSMKSTPKLLLMKGNVRDARRLHSMILTSLFLQINWILKGPERRKKEISNATSPCTYTPLNPSKPPIQGGTSRPLFVSLSLLSGATKLTRDLKGPSQFLGDFLDSPASDAGRKDSNRNSIETTTTTTTALQAAL